MKKICIMGLGYIGLPTASMLATHGYSVLGVDINSEAVRIINEGKIHIEEPGLEDLVRTAVSSGNLKAFIEPQPAEVYIIAVPTPVREDKKACMDYVEAATNSIAGFLKPGALVILESTSPPETTTKLMVPILEKTGLKIGEELFVAYCPEKVLPGYIIRELVENKRIVGGINYKSAQMAKEVYESFVKGEIILTDSTTAEMVKVMENTYRDVNIALANELAKIAYKLGINAWDVIQFANLHPRVNLHSPGPGVGGHCISVDPWFIVEKNPELAILISRAREINDSMPEFTYQMVLEQVEHIPNPKITLLGLTYKPDIDDIRESPAIEIFHMLDKNPRLQVTVCDSHVKGFGDKLMDFEAAVQGSDCVLLAVNHKEFMSISPQQMAQLVNNKVIIDTRNALNRQDWELNGFKYVLLGDGNSRYSKSHTQQV